MFYTNKEIFDIDLASKTRFLITGAPEVYTWASEDDRRVYTWLYKDGVEADSLFEARQNAGDIPAFLVKIKGEVS